MTDPIKLRELADVAEIETKLARFNAQDLSDRLDQLEATAHREDLAEAIEHLREAAAALARGIVAGFAEISNRAIDSLPQYNVTSTIKGGETP